MKAPEFRARVEENVEAYRRKFLNEGLAMKERRLAKLTGLIRNLEAEVEFRGAEVRRKGRKVGSTGLVCETWKSARSSMGDAWHWNRAVRSRTKRLKSRRGRIGIT